MDTATLANAMGHSIGDYSPFTQPFNEAMVAANCTTVNRAAMWCAQIGHESAGLRYMEEIADGSAYEGRQDLGNVHPGDGRRFKGRGPIQLTGRHNYGVFSQWAHRAGYVGSPTYFVDHPGEVATPRWGFLAAAWYWTQARPDLNALADAGNVWDATQRINGGWNGWDDRLARWNRCRALGAALLPSSGPEPSGGTVEKVLEYSRAEVRQDTYYWCGPATAQTILHSRLGGFVPETDLARELGTTVNGTDWIGQITAALNQRMQGSEYRVVAMPDDPPSGEQREEMWRNITRSINAGFGVVANIVAPPSNYPRAVPPSTIDPQYSGGTVYHYFAVMGYREDHTRRAYWIADSGFSPYGYWIDHDQLATLIPPKGYGYATGGVAVDPREDVLNMTEADLKRIIFECLQVYCGPIGHDVKRVALQMGLAVDDAGFGDVPGWKQGGQRSLYDLLAAVAEKAGVERAFDTLPDPPDSGDVAQAEVTE